MALTMSSRIVMWGIGYTLTLLLALSVQAIDYEIYRDDLVPTKMTSNIVLTSRDFLEQLNLVTRKTSYTLQEGTEHLLHFGALLRMRILDTFGRLLYIYYDDFSIMEVEALHKIYQEIFEHRYDIFELVPSILKNPDTRPSRICTGIYANAESCLRSNANICRRIRKQHDLPHPDDLDTPVLNMTYRVYRLSKISKQYPRGFSLDALLKLLQRGVLTITPGLLSGLLYNVRFDSYNDDVRLATRELIRYLHDTAQSTEQDFIEILEPLPTGVLKKLRTMNSFLKYYIGTYAERFPDVNLRRYAFLIAKRIVDDVGTIDENIHLLGNVYERQTINIEYLFDLVLPDDVLDNDVIEAKRYLVRKLNAFDVVRRYLRVQKYQQSTPGQLTMEIIGQLKNIGFAEDLATSLRIHARFWRRSHMIESLDELLELLDAYENLRHVPQYENIMQNIDRIRKSLSKLKDVPVEILCNTPRACLRLGLQSVLNCRLVSTEIKKFIRDFIKLSDICAISEYSIEMRRTVNIPFQLSKVRVSTKLANADMWVNKMVTAKMESTNKMTTKSEEVKNYNDNNIPKSEETLDFSIEKSGEIMKDVPTKSESSLEESMEFTSTMMTTPGSMIIEYEKEKETEIDWINTMMDKTSTTPQEETTVTTTSTVAATTTETSPTTTTLPTTTTTLPTTTTTLSTTTTTLPTTMTTLPTTMTTLPTTTTTLPTTITTALPTTITTTLSTTITTTSPTMITNTEEVVTTDIGMKFNRSEIAIGVPAQSNIAEDLTSIATASMISCESNECISEKSSEENSEYSEMTTQSPTSTMALTTEGSTLETSSEEKTSLEISTIRQEDLADIDITGMTTVKTSVIKGDDCAKSSCSKECGSKSESIESLGRSCEISCDSVMEDCDGEDNALKDVSERVENHTVECPRVSCEDDSSEISSGCETETDMSCECASKKDKSSECVTLCTSGLESSSCEEDENRKSDCSEVTSEVLPFDMKFKRTQLHGLCEIRDPHYRRQMKRLAKMRAISAAAATSRDNIFRSEMPRRSRITTKKLYKMLAAKSHSAKDGRHRKITGYALKNHFNKMSKIKGRDWQRRKQREQIYRLRKRLAKKHSRKLTRNSSMYRSRNIPLLKSQSERRSRRNMIFTASHTRATRGRNLSI